MARVFVSHSSEDQYFVNLLVAVLRFHYVESWFSGVDLRLGTQFPLEIDKSLRKANSLIAVISKNSEESKWVSKEVATFQALNADAAITPLLLDSADADRVLPGLKDFQAVDFSSCMLTGFQTLLSSYGKEFLAFQTRRSGEDRRYSPERRIKQSDRRKPAQLLQRLRMGFWKSFAQHTGMGKFEDLNPSLSTKLKIIDSLEPEIRKYRLLDSELRALDHRSVLEESTHDAANWVLSSNLTKAVYVIEAIAENMFARCMVEPDVGRRTKPGSRRVGSRREKSSQSRPTIQNTKTKGRGAGGSA